MQSHVLVSHVSRTNEFCLTYVSIISPYVFKKRFYVSAQEPYVQMKKNPKHNCEISLYAHQKLVEIAVSMPMSSTEFTTDKQMAWHLLREWQVY